MASSIRLTNSGAPDTPPAGYARLYLEDYNGQLYLKMKRPDGSVQVFGTIDIPLTIEQGGTGLTTTPDVGQFLIGTGTGYRLGDIVAGSGITITKTATTFEINSDISNLELEMPPEFAVGQTGVNGQTTISVTKAEQLPNTVYAGPDSATGVPTFRFLQVDDIPDIPINKIINLIETIQSESLLNPVDSDDIDHTYDSTNKTLSSTLKSTSVLSGSYGNSGQTISLTVRPDGRLDSVSSASISISHSQITDFIEASQDVVGALVSNSTSINSEYDDYSNTLKLHVNEEHLITTNISESENTRAPTSQAIKQYVDDLTDAERNARINEDNLINQRLNVFLNNAPELLDTIVEISNRFEAIEQAIVSGAEVQAQNLASETSNRIAADTALDEKYTQEIERIDADIDVLQSDISAEVDTRISEIDRVYNAIQAHRERIDLTPTLLTQSIELEVEQLSHIMPNSVVAFVDRIGLFEELDFVLANGSNNKVVLNLTPEALTLLDGTEILRISYLTKI